MAAVGYARMMLKAMRNNLMLILPHRAWLVLREVMIMPSKAVRFCAKCSKLAVSGGLCEDHRRDHVQESRQRRNNQWLDMYHDPRWCGANGLRINQLRKEPLCIECKLKHRLTPATVVDHIKPHKGDPSIFYNPDGLQSLCAACHSKKTAKEDGGFNNQIK